MTASKHTFVAGQPVELLQFAQKQPGMLAENPCAACQVRSLSLCGVLGDEELTHLAAILANGDYGPHQPIIDEGEPADYLFNVTSGTVKLYKLLPDGRRQITGFLFAGDFLGIALNDIYACSAETVTEATLCRFPRRKLEDLMQRFPHLERRMLTMASNELVQAQDQMLLLGRKTAMEKLCSFLLSLSQRALRRGANGSIIDVAMNRNDIGDYLGLTTETVSRSFTHLKRDGVIRLLEGGKVQLADLDALTEMAEGA